MLRVMSKRLNDGFMVELSIDQLHYSKKYNDNIIFSKFALLESLQSYDLLKLDHL